MDVRSEKSHFPLSGDFTQKAISRNSLEKIEVKVEKEHT